MSSIRYNNYNWILKRQPLNEVEQKGINIMSIKRIITLMAALFGITFFSSKSSAQNISQEKLPEKANVYKYEVLNIDKEEVSLSDYKGKVLLIVNVASKCGFTPQYEGLEKIYRKYKPQGFEVLAFPCNDFKKQEPGTNEEIKNFCSVNYDVTFPLFDKISVKGENKAPLYKMLTDNPVTGKSEVRWNFEKFLIDKNGNVVKRFRSPTKPDSTKITLAIEKLLK